VIGRYLFIRDSRLSIRAKAALLALVLIALVAFLPLRLVLGVAGGEDSLAAREVTGTVWDGTALDLQAGRLPLGSVEIGLRPLPLFLLRAEFAVDRPEQPGRPAFHAIARGGQGRIVLKDANGELPLAGVMAPLPVKGLTFADFSLEMRNGRCIAASGRLGLTIPSLGPVLPGETVMSGPARCEDGALIVPMQGPSGTERLNLTLDPDGKWRADLVLTGLPVEVAAPLLDMGFSGRPEGIGLSASGAL